MASGKIFTIGYDGLPRPMLCRELLENGVDCLIDCRRNPVDLDYPDFNMLEIQPFLKTVNIHYRHYGNEFGFDLTDTNGKEEAPNPAAYSIGLSKIAKSVKLGFSVMLFGKERDPLYCLRGLTVSEELWKRGFEITHITSKGFLTQKQLEYALLEKYFPDRNQVYMFDSYKPSPEDVQNQITYALRRQKAEAAKKYIANVETRKEALRA